MEKIYIDEGLGCSMDCRTALKILLTQIRQGETVIITNTFRIGKDQNEFCEVKNSIEFLGAKLVIIHN